MHRDRFRLSDKDVREAFARIGETDDGFIATRALLAVCYEMLSPMADSCALQVHNGRRNLAQELVVALTANEPDTGDVNDRIHATAAASSYSGHGSGNHRPRRPARRYIAPDDDSAGGSGRRE